MMGLKTRLPVFAVIFALACAGPGWAAKSSKLPDNWKKWLDEEVYPIISGEERKAFLALETDAERSEFADRLWALWAGERGMSVGAFRREYADRLEECRTEFRSTTGDRARVLLLHGNPDTRKPIDCDTVFWPLEFWGWDRLEGLGQNVMVLFYKPYGLGRFKLWDPDIDGQQALYNPSGWSALQAWQADPVASRSQIMRPEFRCGDTDILRAIGMAAYWMRDLRTKQAMDHAVPPATGAKESTAARFLQFSTLLPKEQSRRFLLRQRASRRSRHQQGGRRGGRSARCCGGDLGCGGDGGSFSLRFHVPRGGRQRVPGRRREGAAPREVPPASEGAGHQLQTRGRARARLRCPNAHARAPPGAGRESRRGREPRGRVTRADPFPPRTQR
jgi:GWxTD domain-containing protein